MPEVPEPEATDTEQAHHLKHRRGTGLVALIVFCSVVVGGANLVATIETNQRTQRVWCPALTTLHKAEEKTPPTSHAGVVLFRQFYDVGRKYGCY